MSALLVYPPTGGIGTTHSSYWAMACMVENPHLQEKVADVVEGAVGHHRMPSLSDRSALKYIEAVAMEALRFASAAPIGVPRKATCDVNFRKYFLLGSRRKEVVPSCNVQFSRTEMVAKYMKPFY